MAVVYPSMNLLRLLSTPLNILSVSIKMLYVADTGAQTFSRSCAAAAKSGCIDNEAVHACSQTCDTDLCNSGQGHSGAASVIYNTVGQLIMLAITLYCFV